MNSKKAARSVSARQPDRRRDRTREALLKAGRSLFAARDVDGVSVDEIVAEAEVAKGSFYNHFADKEVFAREIGAQVRRQVEEAVNQANREVEDPAATVARALCVFLRFAVEHRDSAQVLWKLNPGATLADAPVNRNLRDVVKRGISAERFRHIDLASGVLLIMGVIVISVRHALEEKSVASPVKIAQQMAAGLLRGLGVSPAQSSQLAAEAVGDILSAD